MSQLPTTPIQRERTLSPIAPRRRRRVEQPIIQVSEPNHFVPLPFVLNHEGIGLTYSNVAQQLLTRSDDGGTIAWSSMKDRFGYFLRTLDPPPIAVMVSEETHQDGSFHYHALVRWLGPEQRVDHRFFDYMGIHPNIQQLNDMFAWKTYIEKQDQDPYKWVLTINLDESDDEGYSSQE